MRIKKTYSFAFKSSFYISLFATVIVLLLNGFYLENFPNKWYFLLFISVVFLFSFVTIQFLLERFIYYRIKQIYEKVSILDSSDLRETKITSDISTLSKEVEKFALQKQEQIQTLNMRENYRREFLGNISHELKTPLFTVQGYILTLIDGAVSNKKITKKYLKRANKGVDRLLSIVRDLDMISRLETDDLQLAKEPFNIVKLVQEVYELLEMKARRKNISLLFNEHYTFPIMVYADEERIEQVLTNLIVNSIKYGNLGGHTVISFNVAQEGKVDVKVSDNGEGIEEEHHVRLFERFYRVDKSRSRSHNQGGSGLGLAIVKHIVEAHGETISVESTYKKGTSFTFSLEKFK